MMSFAAAVGLLGGVAVSSCSKNDAEQQQQTGPVEVAVMTVAEGNSELARNFPATIKGKTDISIRPQVAAEITKVNVDEGQRVHKGQVLFTLDQVQIQAAVDQASAAVNSARTSVATAQITEQNKRTLLDKNIISEYEWQVADNQLQQAKAALAQAEASLTNARKNLSYTVVTAPSDGVVGTIPFREGSYVSPSTELTTVSDNSEVYAYFSLTEKDLLSLTDGGQSSVEQGIRNMPPVELMLADGTVYPYKGRVATVSGVIDKSTGSASVRALFDNPGGMLRSGNTGTISIPQVYEEVIVIPQKATFEVQDLRYVFTLNDSNKTVTTPITVDAVNDGKNYVVKSGLKPGDRIVTEGIGTIVRPDMPVKPRGAEAQQ